MNNFIHRITLIATGAALAMGLAACNKNDDRTAGQKLDSAIAKTDAAADEAKAKAAAAADDAKAAADRAGADVRAGASDLAASASAAASAVGDALDDASITASVKAGLAKDPDLSALKIDVDTKNGTVTLQGPAPTAAAKDRAAAIARETKGVTGVANLLKVG